MDKITEIIDTAILKDGVREPKEQTSWYISSLGSCLRGVYFSRLGKERDNPITARELSSMKVGSLIHDYIQKILVESLKETKTTIETEKRVEIPEFGATGYADIFLTNGESEVIELKSANKDSFAFIKKQGAKLNHQMQLWSYLYGLNIKQGRIIYLSKDYMDKQEFIVRLDDKEIENAVRAEFDILNRAWAEKDPSLIPLPEEKWKGTYCNFHQKHCLEVKSDKTLSLNLPPNTSLETEKQGK